MIPKLSKYGAQQFYHFLRNNPSIPEILNNLTNLCLKIEYLNFYIKYHKVEELGITLQNEDVGHSKIVQTELLRFFCFSRIHYSKVHKITGSNAKQRYQTS